MVSVMVLWPEDGSGSEALGSVSFNCGTDNQGNSYLLDKLLTTKYPLGVVLMELAVQVGLRNATLRANWIPRLQNEEADALTNSEFHHFDLSKRIEVDLEKLGFVVMNDFFAVGDTYLAELAELKASEKERKARAPQMDRPQKRRHSDTLREKDPW